MIIDEQRKACVFLNPKTGTHCLSKLFKYEGFEHEHDHPNYEKLSNYEEYTLHCFCRNPLDRFLSCLNFEYQLRGMLLSYLISNHLNLKIPYITSHKFIEKQLDEVYKISPAQILEDHKNIIKYFDGHMSFVSRMIFIKQEHWLKPESMNIYQYENFDESVTLLCGKFGFIPDEIPVLNKTKRIHTRENLSKNEIDIIKEFFKSDYDFFESRGINYD
jgi:hypothetical protein